MLPLVRASLGRQWHGKRLATLNVVAALALFLPGCGDTSHKDRSPARVGHYRTPTTTGLPAEALPGGATTFVGLKPGTPLSLDAFSQPATNLGSTELGRFAVGNSFFSKNWVSAPASVRARDGLGPLFMAAACQDCHIRDGRGHAPLSPDETIIAAALRIARADGSADPVYGTHLQLRAIPGVPAEARVRVLWRHHVETLPDGQEIELRRPELRVDQWAYGPPAADLRVSLRVAPPMIGLGLLEAIPASALTKDGTGGRLNRVRDRATHTVAVGRFGWKAAQPSIRQQALDAFVHDLGVTSSLFPENDCTAAQTACSNAPHGGSPELDQSIEEAVVFYAAHLAPPARRDYEREEVRSGQALFQELGCSGCHTPTWETGQSAQSPALSKQRIFPYTDLRLHDMGPGLADGIIEFNAGPSEWRTAPLWGLGQSKTVSGAKSGYLHDGRARTLAEAILWHGGEAQAARDAWTHLPAARRRLVIRFLATL